MSQRRNPSRSITHHDVADVVARLDPLLRDAVTLVYFDGRSPSEAARILEVAPTEVTSALARAFRHVASWLAGEPSPHGAE